MELLSIPIASASAPADGATTLRCTYNLSRSFAEELHREPRLFYKPVELPSIDSSRPLTQLQRLAAFADITRAVRTWLGELRVEWWYGYGSLVGAAQLGGSLPWDLDSDVHVTAAGYAALWNAAFKHPKRRPLRGRMCRALENAAPNGPACIAVAPIDGTDVEFALQRPHFAANGEGVRFRLAPGARLPAFWRVPKLRVVHARTGAFADVAPLQYIDGAQLQALTPGRSTHPAADIFPLRPDHLPARPAAFYAAAVRSEADDCERRCVVRPSAQRRAGNGCVRSCVQHSHLGLLRGGGEPSFRLEVAKFDSCALARCERCRACDAGGAYSFEVVGRAERDADVRAARGQTCCDRCTEPADVGEATFWVRVD